MKASRAKLLALLALLSLILAAAAPASASVIPMGLDDLAVAADSVVVVRVTGGHGRTGRGSKGIERAGIVTDTQLRVTKVLKGTKPADLTLTQPGGSVGSEQLVVSDLPAFEAGESCILFLNSTGGVVGGYQGKLSIEGGRVPALGTSLKDAEKRIEQMSAGVAPAAPPQLSAPTPLLAFASPGSVVAAQTIAVDASELEVAASAAVFAITPSGRNAGIGQSVTITGSGFGAAKGTGSVRFLDGKHMDGTTVAATTITSWSDTQIVCLVPRWAQSGPVVVVDGSGRASSGHSYTVGFSAGGPKATGYPVQYRINENCGDLVGEGAAIQAAFSTWSGAGSRLSLAYAGTTAATANPPTSANGAYEIYFSNTGFTDSGVLAWNWYWYSGGTIVDSNIIFNDFHTWGVGAAPGKFDIETVALHELGHTAGLDDQYLETTKVMGAGRTNMTRRALSASEVNGAIYLHGVSPTAPPTMPTVTSLTHPSQSTWYANPAPALSFSATDADGVAGYSFVLDQNTGTTPDTVSEGSAASKSYGGLAGGVWYFHVRAVDAVGNWGPTAHFMLRIDTSSNPSPVASPVLAATSFSAAGPSAVAYNARAKVTGTLLSATGLARASRPVVLEVSTDNSTWTSAGTAITGATGAFTLYSPKVVGRRFLRVRFAGDAEDASGVSPVLQVKARLYYSSAPRSSTYTQRYRSTYKVWGYFRPKHAGGSKQIKLKAYRYERKSNGSYGWVHKRTYSTKASNASGSSYTKYTGSVRLPSKGRWRVRAYHAEDAGNATSYSGYRYIRVK